MSAPVALVTGSSRGIGRAIAVRLAADGYRVVVQATAAAAEVRTLIEARGGSCRITDFDVLRRAEVLRAIHDVTTTIGPVSVLVNNMAPARELLPRSSAEPPSRFWPMAADDQGALATTLTGLYNCTKPVVETMLERKLPRGRIINVGGVAGEVGDPDMDDDAASVSGIIGFTKSLARALAPMNITATVVSPGVIATDASAATPPAPSLSSIPLGRLGRPEEVAAVVSFLASDRSAYITGEVIRVDGGRHM